MWAETANVIMMAKRQWTCAHLRKHWEKEDRGQNPVADTKAHYGNADRHSTGDIDRRFEVLSAHSGGQQDLG